ncbi:MAG: hypothetical protein NTW36_04810 [Planctomycetia bacterium]|nr:hypothetical protein [Planctomycetia bacterium]
MVEAPAVTLPVKLYSDRRIKEFDDAEAELVAVMKLSRGKPPKPPRR